MVPNFHAVSETELLPFVWRELGTGTQVCVAREGRSLILGAMGKDNETLYSPSETSISKTQF